MRGRATDQGQPGGWPPPLHLEGKLKRDKPQAAPSGAVSLKTPTYEQAKKAAPGLGVYYLETEWREWVGKKKTPATNPDASVIGFCKSKAGRSAR